VAELGKGQNGIVGIILLILPGFSGLLARLEKAFFL
jgi:hypothetical protein